MALIKCSECGKEISDKASSCPNCGAPVACTNAIEPSKQPQVKPVKEKKKGSCLKTLLIAIAVFILFCSLVGSCGNDDKEENSSESTIQESDDNNDANSAETEPDYVAASENVDSATDELDVQDSTPAMSKEDFIASCQEFNYKTIARNPDEYTGQNFVVDVKIFQTANGKWYTEYDTYYKAYTNDEYDLWMGDFLYIIDCQDKDSDSYIKVLDDDIIRVYGTFNGMRESKNSISGTTNDEVSLDMYYCELLSE